MKKGKRVFDFIFSLIGLSILFPFLGIIALLIKLDDGGPIFYKQKRIGYRGREFFIWKFRTMVVNADKIGIPITIGRDPRVTRVGYWLRKFRIDEIPQLINVLKGEMSLVGPRPEVPQYVELYDTKMKEVLKYVPGMADPTSLSYLNEAEILAKAEEPEKTYIEVIMPLKVKQSLEYMQNATLWTDFLIIIKTIVRLIGIL